MNIKVSFQPTKADIYRVTNDYYLAMRIIRGRYVAGLLALFVGSAQFIYTGDYPAGTAIIFFAFVLFFIPQLNALIMVRRYFSNPKMGGMVDLQINESGLFAKSELGESRISWDIFKGWQESPDAFLLIVYKYYFIIVLKRGFENENAVSEFREFLGKRYPKK